MPRSLMVFPNQNTVFPFSLMHATCLVHLIFFGFETQKFGEEYKSWSCSLCNFLQSPVIPSLLGPIILLSTWFSNIPAYVLPVMSETKFHTHTK